MNTKGSKGTIGPGYSWTISSYGTSGSGGNLSTSGWAFPLQDPPEKIPVLNPRMRKIKVKEEPSMEKSVEKFHTTLMEGVKRMVSASFYGVLGIKVKGTNPPAVSGKIKKIKEGRDEN